MITIIKKIKFILISSEKKQLLLLSLASVLLSFSEVFSISTIIPIIGLFSNPDLIQSSSFLKKLYVISGVADSMSFIILLSIFAIIIFILKMIYSIMILYWQQVMIGKVQIRLTSSILNYYLRKDYSFHLMNNSSLLFKNINQEIGQFVTYLLQPLVFISSELIILSGLFILMFYLYPFVTLILLLVFGTEFVLLNFLLKKKLELYAQQRSLYSEKYYKVALESLNAVKEIQIYNVQEIFTKAYSQSLFYYLKGYIRSTVVNILPANILQTTVFSSVLMIIILSVYFSKNLAELLPMLTIMGFVALRLIPSIIKISSSVNSVHYSFNSLDLVYDLILDYNTNITNIDKIDVTDKHPARLSLQDITFKYEASQEPIFQKLNLELDLGKTTAFIGETGSGKSTLIDIIMGLLLPQEGNVYYGKTILIRENIQFYREKIGYVPQNIFLIDDTIAANIAFGISSKEIDRKKLEKAIEIAQLDAFIDTLPAGINTQVGEKGVRISGGQRQRIGIARALYREPEIIVFDEATSALDVHTEEKLYESVKSLGKTLILVTHRLSTLENADIIYVLEKGNIIEKGTYKELLASSKFLAKNRDLMENRYDKSS